MRIDGSRRARSRLRLVPSGSVVRHWDFDPEDVARLEEAHDAVLEAAERADRRLARGRDRERLAEAEAAERVVLSWMGAESYLDYRLRAAGVVEIEDLLAVVDLTRAKPAEPVTEPATVVLPRDDGREGRPLLRQARR